MLLRMYLAKYRITIKDFAKQLCVSRGHLNALVSGRLTASKALAKEIEKATNGEVRAIDVLIPEDPTRPEL